MGGRSVRVFHISDLHMRSVDGPQADRARLEAASRWRVLGEKWSANIAAIREDEVPVDLLVFTGDLGDWGHPTDYPRALAFLTQTSQALAVPLERLFVIPGNHDIDRTVQREAWESLRRDVARDPHACSRWLAGEDRGALREDDRRDRILERQQAFWAALATELDRPELAPHRSPHRRLGYRQAVVLPGLSQPIHVIGLDTAWLAGDDGDSGQLRLTEHQVSLLTTTEAGEPLPGFRLALMHHRLADLADGPAAQRQMADRVDLLLHGHQHEPTAEVLVGPDHQLLVLATGCLYEGDAGHRYPNACQVIDVVLDGRARPQGAEVRFRGWSERSMFWGDDALLYEHAPRGRLRIDRGVRGWRFAKHGDEKHEHAHANARPQGGEAFSRPPRPPGWMSFAGLRKQLLVWFGGRQRELDQLDEWLLGPGDAAWVVVTGGPGMGKSTILAAWLARREASRAVPPHHFIVRNMARSDQPEVIAASLTAQIEAAYPELRDPEAAPELRLAELLDRVSEGLDASGSLVIVVDGLDETYATPGDNPLPQFLPHVVPAGIRFLCATRSTYPHLSWLVARSGVRRIDLDEPQWADSNRAAVRDFWGGVAGEYRPPLPTATIESAIERADGNLLHAVMLHDAWQALPASERRVDRIPHGLRELLTETWDRATARDESVRVGLGLLCAAQEGLTLDVLAGLAGWDHDERTRVLRKARQLLLEEPVSWAGVETYRPRHDWVRELMADKLGASTLRAHHRTLSTELARWPASDDAIVRRYALRHALTHRTEAGDHAEAWRLAADMSFLEARCRGLGVGEVEADVTQLAARCRASGDERLGKRADDLARAMARESHWLHRAPEATAALVWNRLRRAGWSTEELDVELRTSGGADFLHVRRAAARESSALLRTLEDHIDWVTACAVTPDGRHVVSASDDHTLKIWDLTSGRMLATLQGHTRGATACVLTPDGRHVVSASEDRTLKVWEFATGRVVATLEGHTAVATACVLTPDGRHVVSASYDRTLKVWELATAHALATLQGHTRGVTACAVTPDGRHVVSASRDHTLKVWELATGRALATLQGHTDAVRACAVTPDGRHVVSASEDQTLKVWELATGRPLATIEGHVGEVMACAVTPDGRYVVSGSNDQTLKVWELATGRALASLQGHARGVTGCAVTPGGRHVVSASGDHTLKVWDLTTECAPAILEKHTQRGKPLAVTPDGRNVISASRDKTIQVWDPTSGRTLATLEGHTGSVTACAVSLDGRHVVSASLDGTLNVWDLASGRVLTTLEGHTSGAGACAVTPDGRHVVSASFHTFRGSDLTPGRPHNTLKVWELATRRALVALEGHTSDVTACAVTPDGRHVVSASWDKTLKIWELATGRALATLEGHTSWVMACLVTPDGRHVVSASGDGTLKVWDLATGRALATLEGHTGGVIACAVTPDGRHVVSASSDHTLKVWELATYACRLTHRGDTSYHAVTATSTVIVARDYVDVVWVLDLPPWYRSVAPSSVRDGDHSEPTSRAAQVAPLPRPTMNKQTILFLAANPLGTDRLALDQEARAIQIELERSGHRDRFELVTRWAVEPLDLLRELRKLKPTVVHFSGHGAPLIPGGPRAQEAAYRDILVDNGRDGDEPQDGLYFQGLDGRPQRVSTEALRDTFGAAGSSVQVVVLSACYSAPQSEALRAHVDCVVGMGSAIRDDAARSFAIGFYGGLGERESVAAAYRQGCAAIRLQGEPDADQPRLAVRDGVDAEQLVLAAGPARSPEASATPDGSHDVDRRKTETTHTERGCAASHAPPGETRMTPDDLLTRLKHLLPSQFEEVLFRAGVPTAHLSGPSASQTTRAIEALRHLEQQHQLDQLARILDEVAGPS